MQTARFTGIFIIRLARIKKKQEERKREMKEKRRNTRVRFLVCMAVLLTFGLLAGGGAASAATSSTGVRIGERWTMMNTSLDFDSDTRIVFRNEKSSLTGLYITKEVETASPDVTAPSSDEFYFNLILDGKPAANLTYTLRNSDGQRIYNYSDGQTTSYRDPSESYNNNSIEVPLETDRYGNFTLEAGQTACFEGLEPGITWEVTETVSDERYERISPMTE